jgi:hypothetical protein
MYDKLKRRTLAPAMQQSVQNNAGSVVPMNVRQGGISNVSYVFTINFFLTSIF